MVYSDDDKKANVRKIPHFAKAVLGGLCGMIVITLVHPLDLVKVRMQVYPSARTTTEMARRILRCEGIPALYAGLSAGLLRQATYTTTRLSVYYWLYEEHKKKYGLNPTLPEKLTIGACAGLAGAFAGNPSEVVLVRLMADGKRDPCGVQCAATRPRYRGLFDAIYKIICNEGICALWRGGTLTLTRSLCVSTAQIGTYTQAREVLKQRKLAEGTTLHIYTSVISSFFTAFLTLPVDLIKTRYQFSRTGERLTQPQVFDDIVKHHGVLHFWKGFTPYFIRLSTHTALTYLLIEEVNERYVSRFDPNKKK